MKRVGLVLCVVSFVMALANSAFAHDPFEITSIVRVGEDTVVVETTMARVTAHRIATDDHRIRPSVSVEEFSEDKPKLEGLAPSWVEVAFGGQRLPARSVSAKLTGENDVEVVVTHERPRGLALHLHAKYLRALPEGYTQALSAVEGSTNTSLGFKILTAAEPNFEFPLQGSATGRSSVAPPSKTARFAQFLVLGLEHILAGYDHLLFLAGVLLACRGIKNLFALVTCFTLAHSVTLALASFGYVSVPSRVVEPLIALSIVLVALESLISSSDPKRRLALTFLFGLVHGLGFAGALQDLAMRQSGVALPLFSFNLGIELGQVAVSALLFPVLSKLRGSPRGLRGLRLASVVIAGTGGFWFCERLVTA